MHSLSHAHTRSAVSRCAYYSLALQPTPTFPVEVARPRLLHGPYPAPWSLPCNMVPTLQHGPYPASWSLPCLHHGPYLASWSSTPRAARDSRARTMASAGGGASHSNFMMLSMPRALSCGRAGAKGR